MRDDFNKQLTERERLGHKRKFGDHRNAKANKVLDEEMSGGKESIHTRRRHAKGYATGRKSFNENLNPLKNFLRVNVGRPWDKIYSEITSKFDKRKVINDHILVHLFQYVELNVHIVDGKPCTVSRWSDRGFDPITWGSHHYPTYYVDPRDGIFKKPKVGMTRRQRDAQSAAETLKKQKKVYRKIDDDNHLILKDNIWWVYTAKAKPPQVMEYRTPFLRTQADYSEWHALSEADRQKRMIGRLVDGPMPDMIETPNVPGFSEYYGGVRMIPRDKYFFRRQTASHQQLKAAGVDGMVPAEEPKFLSHREASKYRKKEKKK